MSIETHPWTFIDPVCKKPGFHRVSIPFATDPIQARDMEHIDGRPAHSHELFACDACGRNVFPYLGDTTLTDPSNWRPREA